MKKHRIKKLIIITICACLAMFSFNACNGNGDNGSNLLQPDPITATAEIGQLPAHPVLPPINPDAVPFVHGVGSRSGGVFNVERQDNNTVNVNYGSQPTSWDWFYVDIANWQREYSYVAVIVQGNPSGSMTQVTAAVAYAEMSNRPLVPLFVETVRISRQTIVTSIAEFRTINRSYNFENNLLADQTINRLFFFIDSNPAQSPTNTSGNLSIYLSFSTHHQQHPTLVLDHDPILSSPARYRYRHDCGLNHCDDCSGGPADCNGDCTCENNGKILRDDIGIVFYPTSNIADLMAGAYVQFPVSSYYYQGTPFTDISVVFYASFIRSVTIAAVFEGGKDEWSNVVFLHTIINNYIGQYAMFREQRLNGQISEIISFARAPIVYNNADRTPVEGEFVRNYRITHLRFYINAGAGYLAPGTDDLGANSLNPPTDMSPQPPVRLSIAEAEFLYSEDDGVRVGMTWFMGPDNAFVTIHPETIQTGGIGTVTVNGSGGWNWWAMPVSGHTPEMTLLTIQFRAPAGKTRIGVNLALLDQTTGNLVSAAGTVVSSAWFAFNENNTVFDPPPNPGWYRSVSYDYATGIYTFIIDLARQTPAANLVFGNPNQEIVQIRIYNTTPPGHPDPGEFQIEFLGITFTESPGL